MLNALATLKEIEKVTAEEPVKLEEAFAAYDVCSAKSNTLSFYKINNNAYFLFRL